LQRRTLDWRLVDQIGGEVLSACPAYPVRLALRLRREGILDSHLEGKPSRAAGAPCNVISPAECFDHFHALPRLLPQQGNSPGVSLHIGRTRLRRRDPLGLSHGVEIGGGRQAGYNVLFDRSLPDPLIPSPMSSRVLPAGFIAPPHQRSASPSGDQWLHEIKHDGFRVIARKEGKRVKLYSRPGNDLTYRFPLVVEALAALRGGLASSTARRSPAATMGSRRSSASGIGDTMGACSSFLST
jgi:hypothetical protein